jgi:pimeloyl-ACP methyl ester carboxylesterase/class 3 adenylate cyclase
MTDMSAPTPEIRYARTPGGVNIAYEVLGNGPFDLVFVPGYASNLQWHWELPSYARFLERLASFARLIVIDRRGTGLSDRYSVQDLPPLEDLADDLGVVLDIVGSERPALFGAEDGGEICCMFAATRPGRVRSLVLYSMDPGGGASGWTPEESEAFWNDLFERVDHHWGTRDYVDWDISLGNPSRAKDEAFLRWYEAHLRLSASPATAEALLQNFRATDVTGILPSIGAPTLVLHRAGDRLDPLGESEVVARLIPDAKLVVLPGDHHYWAIDNDDIVDEVQQFLTGSRPAPVSERILSTVLFTDIVGSTEKAAELGDERWTGLLAEHDAKVRTEIEQARGREIATAGDGFLATFDGPARGVRCARAIGGSVTELGLEVRAGVHTGEIEVTGDDVGGIAVHIGARVTALAGPNEVLVSSTVKDLVAGSGLVFEDAGEHELKGVPDRWRLFKVVG